MRLRMLILAAGLLWPVSSFSQGSGEEYFFKTGNVLLENCSGPPNSTSYVACFSYIAGVADALSMVKFACTPLKTNEGQTIDVVLESLRAHPEARQDVAAGEVALALRKAFPCK
jgi:Rap1a immunity proteins